MTAEVVDDEDVAELKRSYQNLVSILESELRHRKSEIDSTPKKRARGI
jgi:hypothetical protein